tara:strand:+ start:115 stop:750 length:636 start_codon:yes stop_codon:yes gene_type:complete
MLGSWQKNWLEQQLKATQNQRWNLIGQQVMVAPLLQPDLREVVDPNGNSVFVKSHSREAYQKAIDASKYNLPLLLDAWDGYPEAREDFLQLLKRHHNNNIVLTGDIHTGICADLYLEDDEQPVALELITPAVTSPGLDDYFPTNPQQQAGKAFIQQNPHIHYIEGTLKGWLEVNLTQQQMRAQWNYVSTVKQPNYQVSQGYSITRQANEAV